MVVHAVYPRETRQQGRRDQKNKRFASIYWEEGQRDQVLRESGFDRMPYAVLRWTTNSDETYGRGLGFDALPEVKKLNTIARDMLEASHKAVDPPVDAPENRRNQIVLRPGAVNYYRNPNARVFPIQTGAQYPIGIDALNQTRSIVETHFMVDFFMMLDRAQGTQMTATEVMERQAEKAAVLGTVFGRVASELLDRVINLVFAQAVRRGSIPPPPPALVMAAREGRLQAIEPEYTGPLAQAQKRFHTNQGVRQALQSVLPLGQVFGASTFDRIDQDALVKHLLVTSGMPASILRDDREMRALAEARAKAQQQQQQIAIEREAADQYQKLKDAPEEGSPATNMAKRALEVQKQQQQPGGQT